MPLNVDVVVVGGGPAGITASVQLSRLGHTVLLFERSGIGGELRRANLVENYPGFPGGIAGADLASRMGEQLARSGVGVRMEEVTRVSRCANGFAVSHEKGPTSSRALIVATGAEDVAPPFHSERVLTTDTLERTDVSGKKVLIVGGGEAAFDRALLLAGRGASVEIIARGEPSAMDLLKERAHNADVSVRTDFSVASVRDVSGGVLLTSVDGRSATGDYVMTCIGKAPRLDLLGNLEIAKEDLRPDHGFCDLGGGLYVVGDAVAGRYRQVAWAVGSGIAAAMAADEYLRLPRE